MRGTTVLFLVTFLGACTAPEDLSEDEGPPVVRGTIDLEIGEMTGEEPYLFSSIGGVAADADGMIYAIDRQSDEIRVFDPEGGFVGTIGRSGEGPGELGGPCCPSFDPQGVLWVRDVANARYSGFDLESGEPEFVGSVPVSHGGAGLWASTTFDTSGRLVDVGPSREGGGPALARYHTTSDGVVESTTEIPSPPNDRVGMHSVDREMEGGPATFFVYQPFGPRHLLAHGPGGRWAESISSEYRVDLHLPDGATVTIHHPAVYGPELSDEDRSAGEAAMARDRNRLGVNRLPYGLPDRKPPVRDLFFGTDGRLWVELNVQGDQRVAETYDDGGNLLGRYEWPGAVRVGVLGWVGTSSLIGVTRDSLGVERLARVRFR